MEIYFDGEGSPFPGADSLLRRAASLILEGEGLDPSPLSLSLTFVDEAEIKELNRIYREQDQVTDVLSFPQYPQDLTGAGGEEVSLGDVVIALPVAERQAATFGHSLEREVTYLFTHSLLHLLGYDHRKEEGRTLMREKEEAVMAALNLQRSQEEPAADDRSLYRLARAAFARAYAPYSNFLVGAALLTEEGQVYTGCNVENAAYGASICAERTAVSKAISEGHRRFLAIAIASSRGDAWPCGTCRQVLFEFSDDLRVITGKDEDHLESCTVKDLLPKGFRL